MNVIYNWPIWIVVVAILVLWFVASEIGFRLGSSRKADQAERRLAVATALKASVLGMVALLLGFSFSITSNRFSDRSRIVLEEANSIGTCYLRAGLLGESAKNRIRESLRRYTDARLEHFDKGLNPADYDRTLKLMREALNELWLAVSDSVKAEPDLVRTSQIVPAANAVIDLSATTEWATRNKLPGSVVVLLGICIVISGALIGHSSGETGKRNMGLWTALNILVVLIVFVILDFDRSRRGLIQIDHTPLVEARKSME